MTCGIKSARREEWDAGLGLMLHTFVLIQILAQQRLADLEVRVVEIVGDVPAKRGITRDCTPFLLIITRDGPPITRDCTPFLLNNYKGWPSDYKGLPSLPSNNYKG